MHRILILIENRENRRLLIQMLDRKYEMIVSDNSSDFSLTIRRCDYDLGILDGISLDRYWEAVEESKKEVAPLFLPFLLITSRQDVEYTTRHLWRSIDEVITTPIKRIELEARIGILLRARRYSYEQKARLEAERERDLIARVINRLHEGIVALDKEWNFVYLNERAVKILSKHYLTDLLHRNYWHEFPESRDTPLGKALQDARYQQSPVTVEYYNQITDSFFETRIFPSSEGLTILMTDITSRKRAEEALRRSEENYRNMFYGAPVGLFRTALLDFRILECNNQLARILGFESREEFLAKGFSFLDLFMEPNDIKQILNRIVKDGIIGGFETKVYGRNKPITWVRVSARLCENGECIEVVVEDITAQKQTEEALLQSEERFRRLAENAPDIIYRYELSPKRGFTYISPALKDVTGYTPEEYYADPDIIFKIIHPDDRQSLDMLIEGTASYERPVLLRWIRKDGSIVWTELRNVAVHDESGNVIALEGIARDITESKKAQEEKYKLQEQLLQLQKIDSIGRLAGGIAHDFNNMLNVILGYGEIILSKLHPQDPLREYMNRIIEAGQRAANLTHQLLAFSRRQTLKPRITNINVLIQNMEDMLRRLIGEDILLELSLDPDLEMVMIDPVQIEQVILNLAANARDAMPNGGRLYIKTAKVYLDGEYVAKHGEMIPGEYVLMSVTDTGIGMDKETLEHIFEPFFTTKEIGKGTGLGLATVYGIIRQSNGYIWVYSEPGKGTTFKIYLPVVKSKAETVAHVKHEEVYTGRGEHILVVEDEKSIRELMASFLTMLGFTVTLAANGGEAILLVEEKGVVPDLVITDIVMPHMSGRQLVDRLRKKLPNLKVIYMSGYSHEIVLDEINSELNTAFIQKPFLPRELIGKIKAFLS
ncbi:MAG: PAS domain S-box protein [Syntrophobacterales bacterium]|nr:PAS domain S-box protein [Syntrophobacterales bacterium]